MRCRESLLETSVPLGMRFVSECHLSVLDWGRGDHTGRGTIMRGNQKRKWRGRGGSTNCVPQNWPSFAQKWPFSFRKPSNLQKKAKIEAHNGPVLSWKGQFDQLYCCEQKKAKGKWVRKKGKLEEKSGWTIGGILDGSVHGHFVSCFVFFLSHDRLPRRPRVLRKEWFVPFVFPNKKSISTSLDVKKHQYQLKNLFFPVKACI